jgi:GTP-binding protein YchF
MEIAIIGLPQSGKSTLFKIMTGVEGTFTGEPLQRGIAKVPDKRFRKLVEIFQPEKITPATVPFLDINAAGEKAWNTIRQNISGADAFVHVVDAFTTSSADDISGRYQKLTDELIIADLMIVENRLEKLNKLPEGALKPEEKIQKEIFPRLKEKLESGKPLRELDMSEPEKNAVRNFAFLSIKPEVIVLNVGEGAEVKPFKQAISLCCKIEAEIAELEEDERREFLNSMNIETPAFERVIRTAFSLLGSIYYFTVGEDEVRAWIIKNGWKAPKAASVIHKDFERGFIKAEVVSYDDFISSGEDLQKAKAAGKLRLEGKEYTVNDGDIISFRFNV